MRRYWWVVLAASSRPTGWPREALTALPQGTLNPGKGPSGVAVTLVRQAFVLMSQSQFSPLCRRRARPNRERTYQPTNHLGIHSVPVRAPVSKRRPGDRVTRMCELYSRIENRYQMHKMEGAPPSRREKRLKKKLPKRLMIAAVFLLKPR